MTKILISIKSKYVKKILDGTKKYEFRTKIPKEDVSLIIIYETFPIKKIVAEAEVIEIIKMKPSDLWKVTQKNSGTSKKTFYEYFKGRETAYAYKLGNIKIYEKKPSLIEFGIKCAPQSFAYIK